MTQRTITLEDALAGKHIVIDEDEVTFGFLVDLEGNNGAKGIMDALTKVIISGDLPNGVTVDGLRSLKRPEIKAVITGIAGSFQADS